MRIRRRAFGLLGGAILLFLVGTNIQSGWLFVLSSLLLGALAGGLIIPFAMVRGLRVERRAPPEAFAGDEVPVDLVVENRGGGSRLSVVMRDAHIAPVTVLVPALPAGEQITLRSVRVAARRGIVEGGEVQVASTAPFGVAEAMRTIEAHGRIVIFPRVMPVDLSPFLAGWIGSSAVHGPSARRGNGQELLGVRDYRYGDSVRNVHWPSTARRGALVVREMEVERPAGLLILVDTWADGGEGQSLLDLCCTVAASVAVQAQGSGHDVLLGAAERGHFEQPSFMGQRAALTWLAGLAAPGGVPLPQVIDRTAATTPGTAAVIVVPSWQANAGSALGRAVARLVRAGGPVVAVVVDAGGFGSRAATLPPGELADLERALASAGAAVRRVDSADDLGPARGRPAGGAPNLEAFGSRR
jgi:uncharacterized protein (DUF58 family)